MSLSDDRFLDVCQNIEAGLKAEYDRNAGLTDERCAFAINQARVAVKQKFGFGLNESCRVPPELQGIVDWCVAVAESRIDNTSGPTLREFLTRMDKVNRSIPRHAQDGTRSYYHFIREFLP
jgi:hypothetical protein